MYIENDRGQVGDHAGTFEAQLGLTDGKAGWSVKDVEDAVRIRVVRFV